MIDPELLALEIPYVIREVQKHKPGAVLSGVGFLFTEPIVVDGKTWNMVTTYPYGQMHPFIPNAYPDQGQIVPEQGDPGWYADYTFEPEPAPVESLTPQQQEHIRQQKEHGH